MLSSEEYNSLLPDRANIVSWKETGSYRGNAMEAMDHIRQKMGYKPICYSCDGDKAEALKDAYNLIIEYETANPK